MMQKSMQAIFAMLLSSAMTKDDYMPVDLKLKPQGQTVEAEHAQLEGLVEVAVMTEAGGYGKLERN